LQFCWLVVAGGGEVPSRISLNRARASSGKLPGSRIAGADRMLFDDFGICRQNKIGNVRVVQTSIGNVILLPFSRCAAGSMVNWCAYCLRKVKRYGLVSCWRRSIRALSGAAHSGEGQAYTTRRFLKNAQLDYERYKTFCWRKTLCIATS